ncbi:phage virion morphogenesis protein [Ignavibacterium sp.]|uniref:phage virion morphogenesis protein n=1 Tax=Ignavibacterium sp. TaxID=2651167 RepID=UPI0022054479|nr:phage virion morphogenesis protein [Ignavibacterium sp.]BDQ03508.1 MAG: hypothetical protein KatS3mg037_2083 [Ignavibacterium sp.]
MTNEFKSPEIIELLNKRLTGNRNLMLSIAETMRVSVLKNFESEGSRLGSKWQRLSPATIKQRQKKKYWPGKILQRTEELKDSITSQADETTASVSTNLIYAAIHHYGGWIHRSSLKTYLRKKREGKEAKTPSKNKMSSFYIPARPFLKLNESDLRGIKDIIIKKLTKAR